MTSTYRLRKVKIGPLRHTWTSFVFKAHQPTNVLQGALNAGPVQPADLALLPASHLPLRHSPLGHGDLQTRHSWVQSPQPRFGAGGDGTAPSQAAGGAWCTSWLAGAQQSAAENTLSVGGKLGGRASTRLPSGVGGRTSPKGHSGISRFQAVAGPSQRAGRSRGSRLGPDSSCRASPEPGMASEHSALLPGLP